MVPLGPGAVVEEFETGRGLREHDTLRVEQLLAGKPVEIPRADRGAESADHAGRMESPLMEAAVRRRADPACRFGGDQKSPQRPFAAGARGKSGRQHGRQRARRRVDDRAAVRVVIVEPVNEGAVEMGRIALGQAQVHADDRKFAGTADLAQRRRQPIREIEPDRREADSERVQDVQLCPGNDIGRNLIQLEPVDKGRQRLRQRRLGGR